MERRSAKRKPFQCAVESCKNIEHPSNDSTLSFHPLPYNPDVCVKWLKFLNHPGLRPTSLRICSDHFADTDFQREFLNKTAPRKLRFGAVPSIYDPKKSATPPKSLEEQKQLQEVERKNIVTQLLNDHGLNVVPTISKTEENVNSDPLYCDSLIEVGETEIQPNNNKDDATELEKHNETEILELLQKYSNFETVPVKYRCRICLAQNVAMLDIFATVIEITKGENQYLLKIFEDATGICPSRNDGLTKFLCNGCVSRLRESALLRHQAMLSCIKLIELRKIDNYKALTKTGDGIENLVIELEQFIDAENSQIGSNAAGIVNEQSSASKESQRTETEKSNMLGIEFVDCALQEKTVQQANDSNSIQQAGTSKQIDPPKDPFVCHVCTLSFDSFAECKEHFQGHVSGRQFICTYCQKKFTAANHLKRHTLIHTNEKPYACHLCDRTFRQVGGLSVHIRRHKQERPYPCSHCSKSFFTSTERNTHLENSKNNPNGRSGGTLKFPEEQEAKSQYPCEYCGKMFYTKHYYRIHVTRIHTNRQQFTCEKCGNSYGAKASLQEHMRTHTQEVYKKCETCSKTFVTASAYRGHIRIHKNERNFVCHICSKGFNFPKNLRTHLLLHSDDKNYTCDECGKAFKTPNYLALHKKVHKKQRFAE